MSSNSILNDVKKLNNLAPDYNVFDTDIIMHTNSALWRLRQLGVGANDFTITGEAETWTDFLGEDESKMAAAKSYVALYVRLLFDPPTNNASLFNAMNQQIEKYELLLVYEADPHYE